jgi:hypothetical protein
MANPYLVPDINNIIEAYISFTDKTSSVVDKMNDAAKKGQDAVADGFNAVAGIDPGLTGLQWAIQSNKLQEYKDQAISAVETLYTYSTASQGRSITVDIPGIPGIVPGIQGVEIQNTVVTMLTSDNVGDAAKTLIADCIPCSERVVTLLSMNPLEDLWNTLKQMYGMARQYILDLFDLLFGNTAVEFFADFCDLLQFLNFMCTPDLIRMATVLTKLASKYAMKLGEISLNDLLGSLLGGSLAPLLALYDKYTQLILAPIECVVDSIDAELQKSDVGQVQAIFTSSGPGERSIELDAEGISKSTSGALKSLRQYIKAASDEVETELEQINTDIRDYLNLQTESDKEMFDLNHHIEMLMRHVGLIKAILQALQQGVIVCGPEAEDLDNFLVNYVAPSFDLNIVVQDNVATIKPKVEGLDELLEVLGTLKKESTLQQPPITIKSIEIGEVSVALNSCLYKVTDKELESVKQFLGSF